MHELSVCQALIEQVQAIARERRSKRVVSIWLGIGPLSGIEPHLLQHAFPLASAGTVAATAELIIDSLPLRVRCKQCGTVSDALPARLVCGDCGDWHTELVSGDELMLNSVELVQETSDPQSYAGQTTQQGA